MGTGSSPGSGSALLLPPASPASPPSAFGGRFSRRAWSASAIGLDDISPSSFGNFQRGGCGGKRKPQYLTLRGYTRVQREYREVFHEAVTGFHIWVCTYAKRSRGEPVMIVTFLWVFETGKGT